MRILRVCVYVYMLMYNKNTKNTLLYKFQDYVIVEYQVLHMCICNNYCIKIKIINNTKNLIIKTIEISFSLFDYLIVFFTFNSSKMFKTNFLILDYLIISLTSTFNSPRRVYSSNIFRKIKNIPFPKKHNSKSTPIPTEVVEENANRGSF